MELETLKTSEVVKRKLEKLTDQMKEVCGGFVPRECTFISLSFQVIEEVKKTEYGKKAADVGEQMLKSTREAAETLEKSAAALGNTQTYQTVATVSSLTNFPF